MHVVVSNLQPILRHDELVRSDRGPVSTEIIQFPSALLSSFEPFHTRAPSGFPYKQGSFTVDFGASLGTFKGFAVVSEIQYVIDPIGELVQHRFHSCVGHSVLGEGECQRATGERVGRVYEYAPAHWTFDVFVPSSASPVKSRKEVLDHADCTEGVTAVWVGYRDWMCYYFQTQSTCEVFFEETEGIAWPGVVLIMLLASSDVVELSSVLFGSRRIFLKLLCRPQPRFGSYGRAG